MIFMDTLVLKGKEENIMRKKKSVLSRLSAIIIAAGMILTACGTTQGESDSGNGEGSNSSSSGEVIRVATMPNHIGLPIQYAVEQGYYEDAGLNIEMILFSTGSPIN